ncbi:MAG: hypothetical protein IKO41_01260, partial [Lachnospiraceae bacterium]|nr:hypothetical protein [Lachnospiraceae bacterium]
GKRLFACKTKMKSEQAEIGVRCPFACGYDALLAETYNFKFAEIERKSSTTSGLWGCSLMHKPGVAKMSSWLKNRYLLLFRRGGRQVAP